MTKLKHSLRIRFIVWLCVVALVLPYYSSLAGKDKISNPASNRGGLSDRQARLIDCVIALAISVPILAMAGHWIYNEKWVMPAVNQAASSKFDSQPHPGVALHHLARPGGAARYIFAQYLKETLTGKQYRRWLSFFPKAEAKAWTESRFEKISTLVGDSDQVRIRIVPDTTKTMVDSEFPHRIRQVHRDFNVWVGDRIVLVISVRFNEHYDRHMASGTVGSLAAPVPFFTESELQAVYASITGVKVIEQVHLTTSLGMRVGRTAGSFNI